MAFSIEERHRKAREQWVKFNAAIANIKSSETEMYQSMQSLMSLVKCGYADRYTVTRVPTCGCFTCELMYAKAQIERLEGELNDGAER